MRHAGVASRLLAARGACDAALLVDPYDEDALAQAIEAAASDQGELRRRGLARAARYSWTTAAEQTWQAYRDTAA